jgi:hypothetical protein
MTRSRWKITLGTFPQTVVKDGVDISNEVRRVEIVGARDAMPIVRVDYLAESIDLDLQDDGESDDGDDD